ncbi:MAG: FAD-dependent monooxygenase [Verrucomicrobiota bacterium]
MGDLTTPDTQVLIIGAGPTGLTMACELARHGVSFRVVDKLASPSEISRAFLIHARTLEIFENMGIASEFVQRGLKIHDANLYAEGKRLVHLALDDLDSGFPYSLSLPQHETEKILNEFLGRLGARVERNLRLDHFRQDDSGVTAVIRRLDGKDEVVRANWLVACDGSQSTVRNMLALPFEGTDVVEHGFLLADLKVKWKLPNDEMHSFFSEDGVVVVIPMPSGCHRIVVNLPDSEPHVDERPPTLDEIRDLLERRGVKDIKISHPVWLSRFYIHHRMVTDYRVGRVFLAGDAAHLHSPVGGQGMNTGIQDAYNLAWKIGLVEKGAGQPRILDSYQAERQAVARALLAATAKTTRVATLRHPVVQAIRNRVAGFLTGFDVVQSRLTRGLAMIGLNYRKSPIVAEHRAGITNINFAGVQGTEEPNFAQWLDFGGGPHAGDRAPDAGVRVRTSEEIVPLYQLLQGTQHNLLLFDGFSATSGGYHNLREIANYFAERYPGRIQVHVAIPHAAVPPELNWHGSIILDPEWDLHCRYGAAAECLYLVRPDGYIGYRSQPADGTKLQAYLETIFVK